jgi:YidC/Oxa1 family membrane protein insertase
MKFFHDLFTALLYQPLFNGLIFLAWLIPGHSIGWAIIVLTILIRLILLPSSLKTLEQQQRIRALQPKMDELKSKHGDDKAAHSKAMMELYAAEKVSPLGGCLPMLVQLPILLVLYQVFIHGLNTSQFSLLYSFTPHMDTINTHWLNLDLAKPEPWVLPIVAGLLQYIQTKQILPFTTPTSTAKSGEADISRVMSTQMMYVMPLFTVFIARTLPAALALYWVSTTAFMVVQQAWSLRRPLAPLSNKRVDQKSGVTVTIRQKGDSHE